MTTPNSTTTETNPEPKPDVRKILNNALDSVIGARNTADVLYNSFPAGDEEPAPYAELCTWLYMIRRDVERADHILYDAAHPKPDEQPKAKPSLTEIKATDIRISAAAALKHLDDVRFRFNEMWKRIGPQEEEVMEDYAMGTQALHELQQEIENIASQVKDERGAS